MSKRCLISQLLFSHALKAPEKKKKKEEEVEEEGERKENAEELETVVVKQETRPLERNG